MFVSWISDVKEHQTSEFNFCNFPLVWKDEPRVCSAASSPSSLTLIVGWLVNVSVWRCSSLYVRTVRTGDPSIPPFSPPAPPQPLTTDERCRWWTDASLFVGFWLCRSDSLCCRLNKVSCRVCRGCIVCLLELSCSCEMGSTTDVSESELWGNWCGAAADTFCVECFWCRVFPLSAARAADQLIHGWWWFRELTTYLAAASTLLL